MPYRLLLTVAALVGGDYLLWNWSMAGDHTLMSLLSGLTLPVLSVVLAWLLILTSVRIIVRYMRTRRGSAQAPRQASPAASGSSMRVSTGQARASATASSSDKLAA